jgi:hypothetical protein
MNEFVMAKCLDCIGFVVTPSPSSAMSPVGFKKRFKKKREEVFEI